MHIQIDRYRKAWRVLVALITGSKKTCSTFLNIQAEKEKINVFVHGHVKRKLHKNDTCIWL